MSNTMPSSMPGGHEDSSGAPGPACAGCPHGDKCREAWGAAQGGSFSTGGISVASVLAFLLPWVAAIAAAAAVQAHYGGTGKFSPAAALAGLGGLAAGALLARLLMPWVRKRFHNKVPAGRDEGAKPTCPPGAHR